MRSVSGRKHSGAPNKSRSSLACFRYGRLASSEKGLFTVVYDRATGGAYVRILNMEAKNAEVAQLLTDAAGYPCTFRAAVEGTVAESDKAVLAAQQEAGNRHSRI